MICKIQQNFAILSLPEILFDYDRLSSVVNDYKKTYEIKLEIRKIKNTITLEIFDEDVSLIVREIFCKYHNIDINFLGYDIPVRSWPEPLFSCIILLNANYDFVNELTIPSIIFNSRETPVEIIVVHNGTRNDFKQIEGVKYIESETSHLPKAYNKAANVARGDYLAFFHDDCFLSDEDWIEKSISSLNEEVIAVGPEYHRFKGNEDYKLRKDTDKQNEFRNEDGGFLKEVPLIMEREKFLELKGFPEQEIFGQEDIFLHQNILNSGRKNLQVDIKNYHFEGISTLSLFSTKQDLIQKLCNHFIFSKENLKGLIKYGFGIAISERIDLCTRLFRNNLFDEEFFPFCEKVEKLGSVENLDSITSNFRNENDRTKKFIDGTVKAFITISDKEGLDIIDNFVDFNEVLVNYINVITSEKNA